MPSKRTQSPPSRSGFCLHCTACAAVAIQDDRFALNMRTRNVVFAAAISVLVFQPALWAQDPHPIPRIVQEDGRFPA